MAIIINTNLLSIKTQSDVRANRGALEQSFERLSTGRRLGSASDDASGLAVATNLLTLARSSRAAIRNGNDAISLINTAEGAVDEFVEIMDRLQTLAMQSASDTLSSVERAYVRDEYGTLSQDELKNIVINTNFNGINLGGLAGVKEIDAQVGIKGTEDDRVTINIPDLRTAQTTLRGTSIQDAGDARDALESLASVRNSVGQMRALLGAAYNRIESAIHHSTTYATALESSASTIMDADFAQETAAMTKRQLLTQSSEAMLVQAKNMHFDIARIFK